jgi:SAM-dependent methyltransferase
MGNEDEIATWNGAIGERWALFQEALDAQLLVFRDKVLTAAALPEGARVLDVGCGCGDLTLAAARAVGPAGQVVGLDVSRPMLARARSRAAHLANVSFVEHDATTFSPDTPFDAVISRFGVMFFEDPAAAFANLRRATRPSGALTFVCWQALAKNAWAAVPLSAVLRVLPPPAPAPPRAPGPFALAEPAYVEDVLTRAGWREVTVTPALQPFALGATLEEAVLSASRMGPAARALREADEATHARALAALRETLAPFAVAAPPASPFALDSAVWLTAARA